GGTESRSTGGATPASSPLGPKLRLGTAFSAATLLRVEGVLCRRARHALPPAEHPLLAKQSFAPQGAPKRSLGARGLSSGVHFRRSASIFAHLRPIPLARSFGNPTESNQIRPDRPSASA